MTMPDAAQKPGKSLLQRHALLIYVSLCLLAWPLYRYFLLPPLKIFLHSDSAVPYLTTIRPWLPQDFFFWSAERFGEVYAVPWKLLGRYVFGQGKKFVCIILLPPNSPIYE